MSTLGELLADLQSGDSTRAEAAATALPAHADAALTGLQPLLQSNDPETRWWAVRSLAGFSHPEASELLTQALADPDAGVQQCAALALSQRTHAGALAPLVSLLANPDSLLARLAGDALVAQGAAALEPLAAALQDSPSPSARVEAARALALIGDTRAIPALFKLLDSESAMLEHWASEGLQKMGVGMSFFKP
ncbi:MAG: HEAT repeat domain-containing protein [Anaerolineales bacterium]|nr:HEAT repeat domain-containing protein [Anaerolineales bacterium]MCL4257921.1 HEAT repeat domain-containing protein [Anaerolineales bacterium]